MAGGRIPESSKTSPHGSQRVPHSDKTTGSPPITVPIRCIPSVDDGYISDESRSSTTPIQERTVESVDPAENLALTIIDTSGQQSLKRYQSTFHQIQKDIHTAFKNMSTFREHKILRYDLPAWLSEDRYPIRHFRVYHLLNLDEINPKHNSHLKVMRSLEEQLLKQKDNLYKPGIHPARHPVDIFNTLAATQAFQNKYEQAEATIKEGYTFTGEDIVYDFQDALYDLKLPDDSIFYT